METPNAETAEDRQPGVERHGWEVLYTYPMPWPYWLLTPAAGIWAWGLFDLVRIVRKWQWAWGASPPAALLHLGLLGVLCMASTAWALARRRVMETNAWVRLDEEGVTVSDWRRRIQALRWDEVQAMYWRLGKADAPASTIHVQGADRTLHVVVEDLRGRMGPLAEEIAARAGLTLVYENRWDCGARYEASAGSTD